MSTFMTYEQISQAFLEYLDEAELEGLSYGNFWRVLNARGAQIEGRNPKVQHDRCYCAR